MPKLTWGAIERRPTFVRNPVSEARINDDLVAVVVEFEESPGVVKYQWDSCGYSGHTDTLEAGQEAAEAVVAKVALDVLDALGLNYKARVDKALAEALQHSQCDGAHHKAWSIDQIVRALTGCPMETASATDCRGTPYTYERQGESEEYRAFLAKARGEFDEESQEFAHPWDQGIP